MKIFQAQIVEQARLPIFIKGLQEHWLKPTDGMIEYIVKDGNGFMVVYWEENRKQETQRPQGNHCFVQNTPIIHDLDSGAHA